MSDYTNGIHRLANVCGELEMGENCRIDPYVTITGKVKLGNNVHIGVGACLFGSEGIEIGDDCSISPGAKLFTTSYDLKTGHKANPQLKDKQYLKGSIKIGNRSIVGTTSIVLPGVVLGDDVLIGALCLVKRSIKDGHFAFNDATTVKKRFTY